MALIDHIKTLAQAYCEARKLSLSRVSFLIFNDGKKLTMIEAGGDLSTRRYSDALLWFSINWPPNTDWPAGVPRPMFEPTRASA